MVLPVNVIGAGPFGATTSGLLRLMRSDVVEVPGLPSFSSEQSGLRLPGRINVLVSWRPALNISDALDEMSHVDQRPWVSLMVDGPILRLGPIVIPGAGACWNCWTRRYRQHASPADPRGPIWQHYASHDDEGPAGYLEPFALMGAVRMSQVIDEIDSGAAVGGSVWEMDMLTREMALSTVAGVHDCPRCGMHRPVATRSFAELREALDYLWRR